MREACIRSIARALGREPTPNDVRNIEARFRASMTVLARKDPSAWRALSEGERLNEAGKHAAEGLIAEARLEKQRIADTIVRQERIKNYITTQILHGRDPNGVEAMERVLVHKYDEKNGDMRPVEGVANATFDAALAQIADIFEAVNPGLWRQMQTLSFGSKRLRKAFTDALHGVREGVPDHIVKAAERYHEIAEAMREQFNAAGGRIGRLENFGAPHSWSARLAERHGRDAFVNDMMGWIDKRAYVKADGAYFTDAELRDFFHEAWATVVSDGMTKDGPATPFPGGAVKANRGAHHRVIHLRPEAAHDALLKYSEQNILDSMVGGLRRMSRDVALVETFGANADHQFAMHMDDALRTAARGDPAKASEVDNRASYVRFLYDSIAGNNPAPVSRPVHAAFQMLRNLQVASKLGSAVITSISDFATLYQTALLDGLNPFKVALNSSLAWSGKSKRYVRRMGLMLDGVVAAMDRYSGENLTAPDLSAKTASAVLRLSGLPFVTEARRVGFSMTMMDAIGHLTRRYADVSALRPQDAGILARKGVSAQTWAIWRAAKLDKWGANHTLLTPDNIMAVPDVAMAARRNAVIDLLSIVREEQDLAVVSPGARERASMLDFLGQPKSGEIGGEIARSVMLFKSFPWTLLTRHVERGMMDPSRLNRFGYFTSMFLGLTAGGVLAQWINDYLNGKDPRTMNALSDDPHERSVAVRNWVQASLKGGALGIYGDFLFSQTSPYTGNTAAETILGPNIGTVGGALSFTVGNAFEAAQDKDANAAAEAVRLAKGVTPGANLWWIKGAMDRYVWHELMEMADPGSVARMEQRQRRTNMTEYWWRPGEDAPERAPAPLAN